MKNLISNKILLPRKKLKDRSKNYFRTLLSPGRGKGEVAKKTIFRTAIKLVFLFSVFSFSNIFAQTIAELKNTEKIIGIKTEYGFIISHRAGMGQLQAHVPMFEINFNIPTKGEKTWHQLYRYPTMGIAYVYANLGNPEVMGTANAFMPYLRLPIIKTKYFEWNYRIALGISYLSKHFDRIDNTQNIAIGSAFNVAANVLFDFHFKLSEKFILSTGIGFSHFSNANFQTPNLGINIPSISIGAYYQLGAIKPVITTADSLIKIPSAKIHTLIIGSFSLKAIYPPGSSIYPAYTLSIETSYQINKRRRIGVGSDWMYDQSLLPRASIDTTYSGALNNSLNFKAGINIFEALVISKLQVSIQMGVYILRKYNEGQDFYHRFGFRYNINKHLVANLSLRTHFAKADCIEWGMGYQF